MEKAQTPDIPVARLFRIRRPTSPLTRFLPRNCRHGSTMCSIIVRVFDKAFPEEKKALEQTRYPSIMAVDSEQAPHHLAYLHDIPGTRCDPADGWPKAYQILPDVRQIWSELTATARPDSVPLDPGQGLKADSLNFQPCPGSKTQDRYVVQQLDIHGKIWTLTGVFDGMMFLTCRGAFV